MSAWSRVARPEGGRAQFAALAGEFVRYGLCSALALACDMGLLLLLHHVVGLHYLVSAAIGFLAGLVVAYALSIRFAFAERRYSDARAEFLGFALVGLFGLGLTQILLIALIEGGGLPVGAAKIVTAGFVFLSNFMIRKTLLFTRAG